MLISAIGASALPGAASADRSGGPLAASFSAVLPSPEAVAQNASDRQDEPAPHRSWRPVDAAATIPGGTDIPSGTSPSTAAVDGAAAAGSVDPATAEAQASAALGSRGVVVTDGSTGIPSTVLAAYRKAEANLAAANPSCHLPWWLLAGIGRIESGHASGGRVDASGTTRGRILGPVLDGSMPGTAVILDSDGGLWDGDATYDRAVGPMQFLPGTFRAYGKDGNGDGVVDPNNVFDAATASGYLLCTVGDLAKAANLSRAVLRYNYSMDYVTSVLTWGAAYRDGVTPSPDSAGTVPAGPARQPATIPSAASAPPAASVGMPAPATTAASTSSSSTTQPPASSGSTGAPASTSSTSSTTTPPRTTTSTAKPSTSTTSSPTTTTTTTTTTTPGSTTG